MNFGWRELPAIKDCVWDELPTAVTRPPYNVSFLRSIQNVTSLSILPSRDRDLVTPHGVLFQSLEYLGVTPCAAKSIALSSPAFNAPKLNTICYHISGSDIDPDHVDIESLLGIFRRLPSPTKKFIIDGYGSNTYRGMFRSPTSKSHVRVLLVLALARFVDSLEFRRCTFSFTPTWNKGWIFGEWNEDWEGMFEDQSPWYFNDDELERDEEIDIEDVVKRVVRTARDVVRGFQGARLEDVFMPKLEQITFNDCTFADMNGAVDFASVLTVRQLVAVVRKKGYRGLKSVNLHNTDNANSHAFAEKLRATKAMQRVKLNLTGGPKYVYNNF